MCASPSFAAKWTVIKMTSGREIIAISYLYNVSHITKYFINYNYNNACCHTDITTMFYYT